MEDRISYIFEYVFLSTTWKTTLILAEIKKNLARLGVKINKRFLMIKGPKLIQRLTTLKRQLTIFQLLHRHCTVSNQTDSTSTKVSQVKWMLNKCKTICVYLRLPTANHFAHRWMILAPLFTVYLTWLPQWQNVCCFPLPNRLQRSHLQICHVLHRLWLMF